MDVGVFDFGVFGLILELEAPATATAGVVISCFLALVGVGVVSVRDVTATCFLGVAELISVGTPIRLFIPMFMLEILTVL